MVSSIRPISPLKRAGISLGSTALTPNRASPKSLLHKLDPSYVAHLRHFIHEGYIALDDFISKEWCEQVNGDLDLLIRSGVFQYNHPGQRVEKLYEHSNATRRLWAHPQILSLLSAIYDDVALPCQTLNFIHGSQQDVHQDLVHLTPFPAGMMCGVWIALEDVHPDSGPLVVYPRSHRLPRLYTRTVPVGKCATVTGTPSWRNTALRLWS